MLKPIVTRMPWYLGRQVAAERQAAYEVGRAAQRERYEAMIAAGAFHAPFAPTHAPQGALLLPEPLRVDDVRAEAA